MGGSPNGLWACRCPNLTRRPGSNRRRFDPCASQSLRQQACIGAMTRRLASEKGSYRVLPGDISAHDLLMSHISVNFDRSGFSGRCEPGLSHRSSARDGERGRHRVPCRFPLFLHGRQRSGGDGHTRPADRGSTKERSGGRSTPDSGLTGGTRAVGALGHFLESEGIATTQISLIYEHTAAIRPSRALWVPFELGRPLGIPNDPIFQKRVLTAALDLLAEKSGPILAEYPEPAPSRPDSEEPWVCPVNLGSPKSDVELADTVSEVLGEISELSPWFELGRERRGRSVFGVSQLNIQDMRPIPRLFASQRKSRRRSPRCFARRIPETHVRGRVRLVHRGRGRATGRVITLQPGTRRLVVGRNCRQPPDA